MKLDMKLNGVLIISPETPLEFYALQHWVREAFVLIKHESSNENGMFKASRLAINLDADQFENEHLL